MLYPCSNHWGPPAHHHQSPGSLLPALEEENQPGQTGNHHLDHVALAWWGKRQWTSREIPVMLGGFQTSVQTHLTGNKEGSKETQESAGDLWKGCNTTFAHMWRTQTLQHHRRSEQQRRPGWRDDAECGSLQTSSTHSYHPRAWITAH